MSSGRASGRVLEKCWRSAGRGMHEYSESARRVEIHLLSEGEQKVACKQCARHQASGGMQGRVRRGCAGDGCHNFDVQ